jgi:hypothetical protein
MRLKAKYSWADDSRDFNFRDGWEHITSQKAVIVVGLELLLWDGFSLEEVRQFRDFPLCIRAVPWVGEDELVIGVLSVLDSSPVLSSSDGLVGRGLVMESVAREGKVRTMQ